MSHYHYLLLEKTPNHLILLVKSSGFCAGPVPKCFSQEVNFHNWFYLYCPILNNVEKGCVMWAVNSLKDLIICLGISEFTAVSCVLEVNLDVFHQFLLRRSYLFSLSLAICGQGLITMHHFYPPLSNFTSIHLMC